MVQRRNKSGERDRISVSLDPEDYKWVKKLAGPSDSYKLSRIVKAARLAGITIDDSMTGGVLEDFNDWLKGSRTKSVTAKELHNLLSQYLAER